MCEEDTIMGEVVPMPRREYAPGRRLRVTLLGDAAGATRALVEGGPIVPLFRVDPGVVEGMERLCEQMRRLCPGAARLAEMARTVDWSALMGPTSIRIENETEGEGGEDGRD